MLTKTQQDHMDDVIARVGKPSPALQSKIDKLRKSSTEGEVISVLMTDAEIATSKVENELLCLVAITRQLEIREQQKASIPQGRELVKKGKTVRPSAPLNNDSQSQSKQKGVWNLLKVGGLVVIIFFVAVAFLSALFDKRHTGPAIEYTIIYTTINGQYYEKEETAEDLNGEYVTFSDGTRVPWNAVKTKKSLFYPDELSANTNSK